jgi:archaellin
MVLVKKLIALALLASVLAVIGVGCGGPATSQRAASTGTSTGSSTAP